MKDFIHMSKFEKTLFSGAEWPVRVPLWTLLQLNRGVAYVRGGQVNNEFPAGGLVVIPPNSTINILASQLCEAIVRGVSLKMSSLSGLLTSSERIWLEGEVAQDCAPFRQVAPSHPLAARMNVSFQTENALSLADRLAFIQAFTEWISPDLAKAAVKNQDAVEQDLKARLAEFINQVPESELSSLSLKDIAKHLCCCERHASRLFHEVCGCSFRSYISELRLKKACQMLAEGDYKILTIAMDSGHSSLAQFNSTFKNRFRMTPTEWRQRNLSSFKRPAKGNLRTLMA